MMKALICELCKGNSFSKTDDFFQCDFCRTKYSPEQAQKLMVEGVVSVDRSQEAANILALAEKSFNHRDPKQAQIDARRVLEIEPQNARAWLLLGISRLVLGVSTGEAREAKHEFELASTYASPAELADFQTTFVEAIRLAANRERWADEMRQVTGALDPDRVLLPKNLAEVYALSAAHIELHKLAYALTSNVEFARHVLLLASETIPRLQPGNTPTSVSAEQLATMQSDFEEAKAIVQFFEPKFKARAPKPGKKGFVLWP